MRSSRISIAELMAVILFVAFGFASFKSANGWWASGLYLATVVLLLFFLLGTLVRPGEHRSRWVGASVFGWGYFALVISTGVLSPPILPTARLIEASNDSFPDFDFILPSAGGTTTVTNVSTGTFTVTPIPLPAGAIRASNRARIGHCLFSLAFAALGAVASRVFFRPLPGSGRG